MKCEFSTVTDVTVNSALLDILTDQQLSTSMREGQKREAQQTTSEKSRAKTISEDVEVDAEERPAQAKGLFASF